MPVVNSDPAGGCGGLLLGDFVVGLLGRVRFHGLVELFLRQTQVSGQTRPRKAQHQDDNDHNDQVAVQQFTK